MSPEWNDINFAGTKPPFSIAVICITRRRILASASTNQGPANGDMIHTLWKQKFPSPEWDDINFAAFEIWGGGDPLVRGSRPLKRGPRLQNGQISNPESRRREIPVA